MWTDDANGGVTTSNPNEIKNFLNVIQQGNAKGGGKGAPRKVINGQDAAQVNGEWIPAQDLAPATVVGHSPTFRDPHALDNSQAAANSHDVSESTTFGLKSTGTTDKAEPVGPWIHLPNGVVFGSGDGSDAPGSPIDPTMPFWYLYFGDDEQTALGAAASFGHPNNPDEDRVDPNEISDKSNEEPNADGIQHYPDNSQPQGTTHPFPYSHYGLKDSKGIYFVDYGVDGHPHDTARFNDMTHKWDTTGTKH
jgi:hypothetical protein